MQTSVDTAAGGETSCERKRRRVVADVKKRAKIVIPHAEERNIQLVADAKTRNRSATTVLLTGNVGEGGLQQLCITGFLKPLQQRKDFEILRLEHNKDV